HQQRQHPVDVERVEREHAILRGGPAKDPHQCEQHRQHEAERRKPRGVVEYCVHSKILIRCRSYRSLIQRIHSSSSRRSSTCSVTKRPSGASATHTVPGVEVTIVDSTAIPWGSRISSGMRTNPDFTSRSRTRPSTMRKTPMFERTMSISTSMATTSAS